MKFYISLFFVFFGPWANAQKNFITTDLTDQFANIYAITFADELSRVAHTPSFSLTFERTLSKHFSVALQLGYGTLDYSTTYSNDVFNELNKATGLQTFIDVRYYGLFKRTAKKKPSSSGLFLGSYLAYLDLKEESFRESQYHETGNFGDQPNQVGGIGATIGYKFIFLKRIVVEPALRAGVTLWKEREYQQYQNLDDRFNRSLYASNFQINVGYAF